MTKFKHYTRDPKTLAALIEQAVDDALAAKGCSLDLALPERLSDTQDGYLVTWESLLMEEY